MKKRTEEICNLLKSTHVKYGRKYLTFTIRDIISMVKNGTLVLSPIQRNFVTKKANGIVFSVLIGRGFDAIWVNYKDGKYYVFDGRQRLTSLLLYFTGATSENYEEKIGSNWGCPSDKKVFVLDVDKIEDDDNCPYNKETLAKIHTEFHKRTFESLSEDLREFLLDVEIPFFVYSNLSLVEEICLYVDKNSGTTSLNATELLKAQTKSFLWDKIAKYAGSLGFETRGKDRLSAEKLVTELLAIYLHSEYREEYSFSGRWCDLVFADLISLGKKDDKEITKIFNGFVKSFNSFVDNGLMSCAKQLKDRKKVKFDPFDLKVVYRYYVENHKKYITLDIWDRVADCFTRFVNSDAYREIDEEFHETYKHFVEQGTSNVLNVVKAEKIFTNSDYYTILDKDKLCDFLKSNNIQVKTENLKKIIEIVNSPEN